MGSAHGPRTAAVLLAGGSGTRVGAGVNKVLLPLGGVPVLHWSLRTVRTLPYVEKVVVVCRAADRTEVEPMLLDGELLVDGGQRRHDSEWQALQALSELIVAGELDVVAIHDAARPLAAPELWTAVLQAAVRTGGAIPVHPLDGILRPDGSFTPPLVAVQTPQAFSASELLAAYEQADRDGFSGTDTAACLERYAAIGIAAVDAPATNLKLTFPEDFAVAEHLLQELLQAPPGD